MKTCDYCMLPVGDDGLEIDGQVYHPLCHKMMVEEACCFCMYYDETGECAPDCTLQAYAEKYLEEEAEDAIAE